MRDPSENRALRVKTGRPAPPCGLRRGSLICTVGPAPAGLRAFKLLEDAMRRLKYVAVAKLTMSSRENTVLIRGTKSDLTFHTMFY
jgi:hypothetical protein